MAFNKRNVASAITSIFFLALIAVACYAHYAIQHLALPVPAALSFLVVILPVAQALGSWYLARQPAAAARRRLALPVSSSHHDVNGSRDTDCHRNRNRNANARARIAPPLLYALGVFTTVLATLAGTHLAPASSLDCALRDEWQALYRAKDADRIKAIQDALGCCGFRSVYDMAWPFPQSRGGKTQRSTCAEAYERSAACFAGWRGEERKMAGLLLAVCVGGWVCQTIVTADVLRRRPSWLQRFAKGRPGERDVGNGHDGGEGSTTRAIDFPDADRYTDDPAEEDLDYAGRGQTADARQLVASENPRAANPEQHHTLFPSAHGDGRSGNEWDNGQ